jgi:hypothetical protein
MKRELRAMLDCSNKGTFDLPIIRRGSLRELAAYAARRGWRWRPDGTVFGGYWYDNDGNAYILT